MQRVTATALALMTVSLLLFGCTMPYRKPVVEELSSALSGGTADPSFTGISQLLSSNPNLKVLWTHGMCSTDANFANLRATALANALGGKEPQFDYSNVSQMQPYTVPATIAVGDQSLNVTFLFWSPLTSKYKQTLLFDNPTDTPGGTNPYKRADLNRTLKINLINDCFSDAIMYVGTNSVPMRLFMLKQVCTALDGTLGTHDHCHLDRGPSPPLVLISESLGSKMLFDAIETIWNDYHSPDSPRHPFLSLLQERIASIQMAFLLANQIPLLDLGGTQPDSMPVATASAAATTHSSLAQFAHILAYSVRATKASGPQRTIVAFSDPNDLLSYRLLPDTPEFAGVRVINVIVSNDDTYLGYVERPDNAHTNYWENTSVIGMIAQGHSGSGPSSGSSK